ncbi:mitochondrial carrier protein [Theileria orientalis]|uniref:Mitochondrial carrier protein n=1 Tax=Theileria orientalis TaxID=68886 RepID=A0A976MB00_THEOR|nr:mitochondrial carrier protein [Theileria orientalis]
MDHVANVVCGGIAGVVADLSLYPLDTLKTRSQVKKEILFPNKPDFLKYKIVYKPSRNFRGTSLYSGLAVLIGGDLPSSAAFYGIYELTKDKLHANKDSDKKAVFPLPVIYFLGSTFGQISSLVIRNPFEVVKQQLQAGLYTRTAEAFYNIQRLQGFRGFYAGFFSTLMREIPFDGIQFVLWEKFRSLDSASRLSCFIADKLNVSRSSGHVIVSALCGSVAGGISGALTTPLDVAKTRLMTQGKNRLYKSTWDCLSKIAADEGPNSLFKGLGLRVSWLTIGGFIFFAVLEAGKVTIRPAIVGSYDTKKSE